MPEAMTTVGDVELCHEEFGDPADPALLLVMGLGTQMLAWREEFCRMLADEGFFVIRYDNRDIGRSTHISDARPPGLLELATRRVRNPPYTLDDLADDAAGLIAALTPGSAHVVGASMGGMIAQMLAARHPGRVRSLTSIMSSTGKSFTGQPSLKVLPLLTKPPARTRADAIDRIQALFSIIGSPGYPSDPADMQEMAGAAFDRETDRRGAGRQLGAILASGDREAALRTITSPTLVVHGTADRMVNVSGGKRTAHVIPGARLELIEGMGHDLPKALWPRFVELITAHARAADAAGDRAAARIE
jgi:pimeloyl-ACP methyl ester carboxylesterase